MSTKIEFTDRMNLAESAAIKILQSYCPNTALDEILAWRKELLVIALGELTLGKREYVSVVDIHYWIKNDKTRDVIIGVYLDHDGQRWFLQNAYTIWGPKRPGRNLAFATGSLLSTGEVQEKTRRQTDFDLFDGC